MRATLADAVALWRQGRSEDAERACARVLAATSDPQHSADLVDVHVLLAEIYTARSQHTAASEQLRQVADIRPGNAAVWRRLGDALFASGAFSGSAHSYRHSLKIEPDNPRGQNNLARALERLGDREGAIIGYRRAIAIDPGYAIAHNNLGVALATAEDFESALASYERACALKADFAEAWANRGNALLHLRRLQDACVHYERALALSPRNATILCNCGNALSELHRADEALSYYDRALHLAPDSPETHNSRGSALWKVGRADEALAGFDRAIELQPAYPEALVNKARALMELGRLPEAIACCDDLLRFQPDHPTALLLRGLSLFDLDPGFRGEAMECLVRLWKISPAHPYALGHLLYAGAAIAEWSWGDLIPQALGDIAAERPVSTPLAMLSITDVAESQLRCARSFLADSHAASRATDVRPRSAGKRIRVAYLSGDLREHPVAYLTVGVLEQHDRERFEVIGVSFRPPDTSRFGARVHAACDRFLDVSAQSDRHVADLLRDMEVDIAVDLVGCTRGQRPAIFGLRCAPVQVSYLGFPGTSGTDYMDYILADEFVVPTDSRQFYSEKVVWLPDCFQANDDRRIISSHRPDRHQLGLPDNAFVYCCFNGTYKITPSMFDIWCRILAARSDSVLWVLADSPAARTNLLREARIRGIGTDRFIFAGKLPYDEHLARLPLADLFLDTLPFNAGTTASDALWAGLPLLTCPGEAFAARMAGSLLRAIGLPDLIAPDLSAYERLATQLAAQPLKLQQIRERLASNRSAYPLFDTQRFCRHLESAYRSMHDRQQRSELPEHLSVPSLPRRVA